jgi:transcriptional regulator with XRE-family HTH domain
MIKTRRTGLARRRRTVGLSQQDLADQLRVDVRSVGRWEAGTGEPQPWLRISLARALEVTAGELEALLRENQHAAALNPILVQPIELSTAARQSGRNAIDSTTSGDGLTGLRLALADSVAGGALSNSLLSDLEQTVLRCGQLARDQPAGVLLADLTADLSEVQGLFTRPRPLHGRQTNQSCGTDVGLDVPHADQAG